VKLTINVHPGPRFRMSGEVKFSLFTLSVELKVINMATMGKFEVISEEFNVCRNCI